MRIVALDLKSKIQFLNSISYSPTGGFKAIGQIGNDEVIEAAVGYDHWTPNSVQMHIWIPHPESVSRTFFREGFRYPFEMCGRGLVVGLTPSNNSAALHFNRRIGFKEVYRMKDAWDIGTDVVVQEMRKEDCRWLRRSHELVKQATEAHHEDSRSSRRADPQGIGRVVHGSAELLQ